MTSLPSHLESIYETLRDRICLLTYAPGTRLREVELSDEFGISRTPLRQVLQQLQIEGLVESRNGVGTLVTGIDYEGFHDTYAMRLKVAELIGEMAVTRVEPSITEAAESLLQRAIELRQQRDLKAYWVINHEVHHLIGGLIGNSALRELWDRYYYQTARIWYGLIGDTWEEEVESLCAELTEALRYLRIGDLRAVGFAQRNYIALGYARVLAHGE